MRCVERKSEILNYNHKENEEVQKNKKPKPEKLSSKRTPLFSPLPNEERVGVRG
jgi:hypothetical protein